MFKYALKTQNMQFYIQTTSKYEKKKIYFSFKPLKYVTYKTIKLLKYDFFFCNFSYQLQIKLFIQPLNKFFFVLKYFIKNIKREKTDAFKSKLISQKCNKIWVYTHRTKKICNNI